MEENGRFECDVAIVGTGVAGLYCALNLPRTLKIAIVTKALEKECDSYLAQGGICVLKSPDDYESYFEDTMRAGHYENRKESVDAMISSSPEVISDLVGLGVRFEKNEDGSFKYTREGAHSTPRILFHEDITGKEITSHLLEAVKKLTNVSIFENTAMLDIITGKIGETEKCLGIIVQTNDSFLSKFKKSRTKDKKNLVPLYAKSVVWACGGIGGLFEHSTNFPHLTGDALAVSILHGIPLENPDYIQIHPTTLFKKAENGERIGKKERSFLISESVRGEKGILLNSKGERFVNELLPRDKVTEAILAEMAREGSDHVLLSMEKISGEEIRTHFRHIWKKCLEEGFDCTREPIPVVPAQHYFMGGVAVDQDSRTSMEGLYAVGETSCNGVHGKNRLASNSLLESLVFAKRAAKSIESDLARDGNSVSVEGEIKWEKFLDTERLFANYRSLVLEEIERWKKMHESRGG